MNIRKLILSYAILTPIQANADTVLFPPSRSPSTPLRHHDFCDSGTIPRRLLVAGIYINARIPDHVYMNVFFFTFV